MDVSVLLLGAILLVMLGVCGAVFWLIMDKKKSGEYTDALEAQLRDFRETLDTRLHRGNEMVSKQIESQATLMHKQMHTSLNHQKNWWKISLRS